MLESLGLLPMVQQYVNGDSCVTTHPWERASLLETRIVEGRFLKWGSFFCSVCKYTIHDARQNLMIDFHFSDWAA